MLRVRVAFAFLASGCICEALPDVNKPPFPIVNVIADQPVTGSAEVKELRDTRSTQQSLLKRIASARETFEASASVRLEAENQQLRNLRQMSARTGVLAIVNRSGCLCY